MNRKHPQSLAVIDIGTNSIHMLIARRVAGDWRILQDEKDPSIGATHFISDETMDRAVATVTQMCESARARNVEAIIAVATSAMRDASNRGDFLQRVRHATGVKVHVLSGAEESAYIYRAVRVTIDLGHRRAVCIDLGGGSVELIVGTRDALELSESLPLGSLRIATQFGLLDRPHVDDLAKARQYIRAQIANVAMRIRALTPDFCVGTAGTIKTIAKNATTIEEIDALLDEWCKKTAAQRIEHCDVDELHAPTIIAGTLVLREVMHALQFTEFTPCSAALREGILTAAAASREEELPVRQRGVLSLAERTGCDALHGAHVARLATRLFDQTARLHNLGAHARELLAHAALLHESGMQISQRRPQRHTRYIVRNAELHGFDDDEIGVIAEVAGHHRKSPPHHDAPDVVAQLSAILRIAEALDRGHRQCVDDAHVTFGFARLHVNLATNADATGELALASKRARYFAKLFEREVSFAATVNASGVSASP